MVAVDAARNMLEQGEFAQQCKAGDWPGKYARGVNGPLLAAVGYYSWNEYSETQRVTAFAERQRIVRGCQEIAETVPGGSAAQSCRASGYTK